MQPFQSKVEQGQVVSGPIVSEVRAPGPIKALQVAGHDFIWLDMEHAMYGWETLHWCVQYARAVGIAPLVRVTDLSYALIARALDAGPSGIVVPRVETREQVEEAVACTFYSPLGRRGAGGEARYLYEPTTVGDAVSEINAETTLIVQIETVRGLENLDAMLSVEGVSVVCIGPQDLSISLGVPGDWENPTFIDAVMDATQRIVAAGKMAGMVERAAPRFARWHAAGARFYACNTDLNMIATAARADVAALRELATS